MPEFGASDWLRHRAFLHPEREALVDGTRRLTYGQLDQRVRRLSVALRNHYGIRRFDRVATLTRNCCEWIEVFFASAEVGAILVPLNWRLSPSELGYQLRDCGARLVFVDPEHAALADQLAADVRLEARLAFGPDYEALLGGAASGEPAAEAPASFADPHLILYTSGTAGWPKGAILTHANIFWNCVNVSAAFGLSERDTTLTLLPTFHAGGVGLLTVPTLHLGGRVVVVGAFDAEHVTALLAREQVAITFGVPTMWLKLLERPEFTAAGLPAVRVLGSGGAPLPIATIDRLAERGFVLLQGYGLTEIGPGGTLISPEDWRRRAGTVGKAMLHVRLRVVDEAGHDVEPGAIGEVLFKGPNVFAGYWNQAAATAEAFTPDGWFRSGDLGRLDEEGFLTLVDRKKDMIISGGENIYSAEVEDALAAHPAVAEAAIIGTPDEQWGEVVRGVVVLRPGQTVTAEELIEHCCGRLAHYKVPRSVVFVEALPHNATGKVVKPELRRLYGGIA